MRTVVVEESGALLDLLPAADPLAWVRDGQGLVGWGRTARIEFSGDDHYARAGAWWRGLLGAVDVVDEVRRPGTGPVAFGSFAFDPATATSVLVVPEIVVGHDDGVWWLTTTGPSPDLRPVDDVREPAGLRIGAGSRTDVEWMDVVAEGVRRIRAGQLDKVVLARDVVARADEPLDVRWPLRRLARDYPDCWLFCVEGLVGATPEMLVRLRGGEVTSRVLAGTLRRGADDERDLQRVGALSRSPKDRQEHEYSVRSVVEALSPHCGSLAAPADPFVLQLHNVMHLASDVRGTVADGASSFDLLSSLHPSAAVGGTPTAAAVDLIRDLEGFDRGRYTGAVGWLDASGDGEWGIALRCGQLDPADPRRMRLYAGCGIVRDSSPADEFEESEAKLEPMLRALGTAGCSGVEEAESGVAGAGRNRVLSAR